ncbi:hypothetical protein [Pectobacterium polaris]|uniref:hypothetical protein n=1 Tax=Pectobacterium polaris TaxID=2042057 RepID=UPI0024069F0B|nr:hypothetical protein [Pectobacterium polaris]MDG0803423.1 hypothetical protein [Pectobacterium polaris]
MYEEVKKQNRGLKKNSNTKDHGRNSFEFLDNRAEATSQGKRYVMVDNSSHLKQTAQEQTSVSSLAQLAKEVDEMKGQSSGINIIQRVSKTASEGFQDINPDTNVIQRCQNKSYKLLVEKMSQVIPGEVLIDQVSSSVLAENSIKRESQLAFIINTILPYDELSHIHSTINAMIDGLNYETDNNRIAIILGVNAPEGRENEMEAAITAVAETLNEYPFPIAIVRSTFRGKFPHGTMRNLTLHSNVTCSMTSIFTQQGFHPYISFQDSDASSRRIGSDEGPHVFHAVEHELAGIVPDDSFRAPTRPLMVAGGYRPQNQSDLYRMTEERLAKAPLEGITGNQIPDVLSDFVNEIDQDMQTRDMYARLDPMLPYAPEPNLFMDATAAYHGRPESVNPLMFGPNASEYAQLSRALANFNRMELEDYYSPLYEQAPDIVNYNDGHEGTLSIPSDKEEIINRLKADSQNNRHPRRGQSFHSNYAGMAVATDLSRLAYGKLAKKQLQSHNLAFITTNLFERRENKKNVSLAKTRDEFIKCRKLHQSIHPYMDQFVVRDKATRKTRSRYYRSRKEQLGGKHWQKSNSALRNKFKTGPFEGLRYGVSNKRAFHQNVAIAQEIRTLKRSGLLEQLRAEHEKQQWAEQSTHINNLRSNPLLLNGTNVTLRMSQWTEADGECGIYALGVITGRNWNRDGLVQYLRSLPESYVRNDAIARISGVNLTRWLSDDDIMVIAQVLGIAENLAIVRSFGNQWFTQQGDPTNAEFVIGGVPASPGGPVNHWVVLKKE